MKKKICMAGVSLLIPIIAAIITMCSYSMIRNYVNTNHINMFESEYTIRGLFESNYVLYKNLYEKIHGEGIDYADIYLTNMEACTNIYDYEWEEYEEYEDYDYTSLFNNIMQRDLQPQVLGRLAYFDYYVEDLDTGAYIGNTSDKLSDIIEKTPEVYSYYVEIIYDENGSPSIGDVKTETPQNYRKNVSGFVLNKNQVLAEYLSDAYFGYYLEYGNSPKNCRIIYALNQADLENYLKNFVGYEGISSPNYNLYGDFGIMELIALEAVLVMLLALFLPFNKLAEKRFGEMKCFCLPLEIVVVGGCLLCGFLMELLYFVVYRLNGNLYVSDILLHGSVLLLLYLVAWYIGLCLRPVREKGIKKYIKENTLVCRFCVLVKKEVLKVYTSLEQIDVTKNSKKVILKVVLMNGVILFLITLFWVTGIGLVIVYSILLYFLIKMYISRLQEKYAVLLEKINEISEGNLNVEISEDLGVFNPFKEQLLHIQEGFRNAVEEEVKSQKMKTELITNVSHDLKTPLTAIITYVDLLKDENLTKEQREEYLETLEKKSLRLKVLIEDLFEISKANSKTVNLQYMDVDICSLIKQTKLEMSDKLEEANLDVRMELPDEKVMVSLDSQKTYRIYENLFSNVAKYSLPGTRVFVQVQKVAQEVVISFKNISAEEITIDVSVLAERFVRGDASRNTEGSGLGLAIVKSFVELQGGRFVLESDGDLFKVITAFPCL